MCQSVQRNQDLHVLVVHEDQAGIDRHVEGGKLRDSGDDPRPRALETLEAGGEALVVAHLVALPPARRGGGVGARLRQGHSEPG